MRIQHSIDIDAPRSRVWDLTVDVEALPDHTPTMSTVERLEQAPLTIGSKVRIKQPAQRSKIWTITEFNEHRRFSWTTTSTGTTMTASHDLVETSTGTRNALTVEMNGLLGAVFGIFVQRQIQKALAAENGAFKTAAETQRET